VNDTVALKVTSLQRCAARARSAYQHAGTQFHTNYDLQDVAVLNILRACETAIDLANMLIRSRHLVFRLTAVNRLRFCNERAF
jgi:hypothetical protein